MSLLNYFNSYEFLPTYFLQCIFAYRLILKFILNLITKNDRLSYALEAYFCHDR